MRQWTRTQSQSRDRKKPRGPTRPVEPCTEGRVQPIENRAEQHYSGQSSSSRRGTETDAYASARHDYDADQCPAIFTGLPPSKLGTGSLTAACQFTFIGGRRASVHLCCLSHPAKTLVPVFGCCLGTEEGQLVEQQYEEVTFSLSIWNPLRSYCARSSFVGTSGNIFWLNAGGKGAEDTDWGRRKRRTVKIYRVLVNRLPHWKTSWPISHGIWKATLVNEGLWGTVHPCSQGLLNEKSLKSVPDREAAVIQVYATGRFSTVFFLISCYKTEVWSKMHLSFLPGIY